MLAALIIVFREVLEAGLIIGIAAAVTHGQTRSRFWIGSGVLMGIAGSCLLAAFIRTIASAFDGSGQEIFNASVLGVAVVMLAWHNIWMARHGRALSAELEAAGEAVNSGSATLIGLSMVVATAVLREGSEVVLFLAGVALSDGLTAWAILIGGILGLGLGGLVSLLTYMGLLTIPPRQLFRWIGLLIAFLAAGMAAQAIAFLEQGGVIYVLGGSAWNTSAYLPDSSVVGRVLHTIIGYSDNPSKMQLLAYITTLASILILTRLLSPNRKPSLRGA